MIFAEPGPSVLDSMSTNSPTLHSMADANIPNGSASAGSGNGIAVEIPLVPAMANGRTELRDHRSLSRDLRYRIKRTEIIVMSSYPGEINIEDGSVISEMANSNLSPLPMPQNEYNIQHKMKAFKMASTFIGFPSGMILGVSAKNGDATHSIVITLGAVGVLCCLIAISIDLWFRVRQTSETPCARRIGEWLILVAVASTAGAFLTYLWMTLGKILAINLFSWCVVVSVLTAATPIMIRLRLHKSTSTSTGTEESSD
eukprot:Gb_34027 [translate_table: standard]